MLVLFLLDSRDFGSSSKESTRGPQSPILDNPYSRITIVDLGMKAGKYTQDLLWQGERRPESMDGKNDDEILPVKWMHNIARTVGVNCANYEVTSDIKAPGMVELSGWLENNVMRPDGCFLYTNIPSQGKCLTALWTETESQGDFASSVNKTIRGITAQLRCLRCYSPMIVKCIGFMFPTSCRASCVVMVTVTWENLTIRVYLNCLKCGEVKGHVIVALKQMDLNHVNLLNTKPEDFFIRLSEKDCDLIVRDAVQREFAIQIPSKHSIIVSTRDRIYKVPPTFEEVQSLEKMYGLYDQYKEEPSISRESVVLY